MVAGMSTLTATPTAAPVITVGPPAATPPPTFPLAAASPRCPLGIVRNERAEVYHATPAVGIHRLSTFGMAHPALYHWRHIQGNEKVDTPSMQLGRATHVFLLEGPEAFERDYVVVPEDMDFTTKEGKSWKKSHEEGPDKHKDIIKHKDFVNVERMRIGFQANPDVQERLMDGEPEVVLRKVCGRTGLLLQCRFDWLNIDLREPLDLKTTSKEIELFQYEVEDRAYTRQVAWYSRLLAEVLEGRDGLPFEAFADIASNFMLAAQETFPTWRSQAFRIDLDRVRDADQKNQHDVLELARCIGSGIWPDNTGGVVTITPRR